MVSSLQVESTAYKGQKGLKNAFVTYKPSCFLRLKSGELQNLSIIKMISWVRLKPVCPNNLANCSPVYLGTSTVILKRSFSGVFLSAFWVIILPNDSTAISRMSRQLSFHRFLLQHLYHRGGKVSSQPLFLTHFFLEYFFHTFVSGKLAVVKRHLSTVTRRD